MGFFTFILTILLLLIFGGFTIILAAWARLKTALRRQKQQQTESKQAETARDKKTQRQRLDQLKQSSEEVEYEEI